ncbi:DNA translocase FtsK [Halospina denitrificans]|uniref:DNA translocase FtsK n=1 Tax=Halospina denitrificans TaxID=332522 RepID=A0A4R7JT93_9GAMM|nr:DNA translocase FtsK [Halospina denitrificans]TDT41531.1 DNA translocase FtsK [Halospina denitrificans]
MANTKTGQADQAADQQGHYRFRQLLAQGGREGGLIALIVLCLYLVMALVSHNPADPGWASIGHQTEATNYAGRSGAWIASLLITFFGKLAWLFPVLGGWGAILLYRQRGRYPDFHWPLFLLRSGGFILLLMASCGLFGLYSFFGLGPDSGGVIGDEIGTAMVGVLNRPATTLILAAIALFGVTLFTGLSWIWVVDTVGLAALKVVRLLLLGTRGVIRAFSSVLARLRIPRRVALDRPRKAEQAEPEPPLINNRVDHGKPGLWRRLLIRLRLRRRKSDEGATAERREPVISESGPDEALELPPIAAGEAPEQAAAQAAPGGKKRKESEKAAAKKEEAAPESSVKISPFKRNKSSSGAPSGKANQPSLFDNGEGPIPPITILDPPDPNKKKGYSEDSLQYMSQLLEEKLADFGVAVEVVEVNPGPVITRFEIKPAAGVKVSRITNLAKDLARSLAVLSVRVVEVIPGKSVVGIEIPNEEREMVRLSEILTSKAWEKSNSPLTLALGNDIGGDPVVADLAKMPHLLVAGTTGSGKSVGVNAMILSMLLKATPEDVRLIMIDPKMLELNIYEGIPHLLAPVVTDMKEAANALRWCVAEMERRYQLMSSQGVRNLSGFNRKVRDAREAGEPIKDPLWNPDNAIDPSEDARPELEPLPYIVVVVDEFADMMMIVGKKVEELIARIAQKARAAGIHLILATQRPSVDVITGLIKANIPTRMSFSVQSKVDSRTVLDQGGAEQLLGNGDMLYLPPGSGMPERVHGAFVEDDEVHRVVEAWKRRGEPDYVEDVLSGGDSDSVPGIAAMNDDDSEKDALFDEAVAFVTESRRVSISSVQRKFKIGYNRAANLVEAMEASGVVSPAGQNGGREVLAAPPPRD